MIFLSSALRWRSGSFRRSRPFRYSRSKAIRTIFVDWPLEFVLQHRKIGGAVGGGHDDLAVDHRRRCLDVPGVVGHLLEAMRPVVTSPGEDLDGFVGKVDLDAVAVELDFVDPAGSGRHLRDRGCQSRLDEARQGRLDADRLRFLTLKRHDELHATS